MSINRCVLGSKLAVAGFASVFLIAGSSAVASVIPSEWSFETLSDGDAIVDTNGVSAHGMWQGSPFSLTNNAAEAVALSYTQPLGGYPLPLESHAIIMQILGDVSNNFDAPLGTHPVTANGLLPAGPTNVWIDMVVSPGQLSFQPGDEDIAGAQLAAYVNTNGYLVIRHRVYDISSAPQSQWSELNHAPINTGDFVRLSIKMNYIDVGEIQFDSAGQNFYQIYLDGVALSSTNGYSDPATLTNANVLSFVPDTGTWFLAEGSGFGSAPQDNNNNYLSAIAFSGAGIIDDINVAETIAAFSTNTPALTPFEQWLQANGIAVNDPHGDEDEDGASNWAEYVAGTEPDDEDSLFEIIRTEFSVASNCIWWVIGTETNLTTDFVILRASDLAQPSPWTVVASNLTRSASGTNFWYDTTPPSLPTFYRPGLVAPPAP